MNVAGVGRKVEGVVGGLDGLGLVAEVEGDGDGFFLVITGVDVGFGCLVEVDGLATAVPEDRMLAAKMNEPAIVCPQFPVLVLTP